MGTPDDDLTADAPLRAFAADPALAAPPAVRVHNTPLVVLAVLASLAAMHWAASLFVPLMLGLTFSYALAPLVNRLVLWRLPRALAAALVLSAIVGAMASIVYNLSDDAAAMVESLPAAAHKLRLGLGAAHGKGGAIERVQKAASELERAAEDGSPTSPPVSGRGPTLVQVQKARFNVRDYLWPGALGLATAAGQASVVFFVTFFLLVSGDTFRRKMVRIAGPSFGQKKITLLALDQIDAQIQRYLMVQVFTSAVVGVATWLAFRWLGVDNAAVWGVVSFALNFIPYVGSILVTAGSALLGLVQFGSLEMALLIGGTAIFIHSLEGYLLTPWLTGKASRMNPVAVFVGVLAWGWLWGVGGLFLGVPILLTVKAVCDRMDDLKPVGELLGD